MRIKNWPKLILVALTLAAIYWPGIRHHWEMARNPYFVPYDAAQYIPAFFKFEAKEPVPTTYAKEYYLNAVCPILYKWSLGFGAQFSDVRHFQLGMMYLSYLVFLGFLGRMAWRLGGAALSFAVVALTISAWIFIGLGFIGGAPRMYGYTLISVVLYALIMDRPTLLAVTVVLGGLLYPIIAVIGGFCLVAWMFLRPLARIGLVAQMSLSRRIVTVALTAVLSLAALTPLLRGSEPYGRRIVDSDIATYPEAGPDGNYRPYDQLPYKLFGYEFASYLIGPLYSHGDPIVPWLNAHQKLDRMTLLFVLAITGITVLFVVVRGMRSGLMGDVSGAGGRLMNFFAVCGLLHIVAWFTSPYLYIPTRYFMFSLPFVVTLLFPWSLYTLLAKVPRLRTSWHLRNLAFLGIIAMYLVVFGGRGNVEFVDAIVEQPARPLFDAIAALPKDAVVAGWPVGEIRKVEYVTRRNVFLTGDLHQVLHLNYLKAMRERMDALFDAYLSVDVAPLDRLRQEFGVTHLIVETRDFTDPKRAPEYFAPWRSRIQPRLKEIKGKEYLMNGTLHERAAVFNQNGLLLLDLAKMR